jgi:hypothetical protein
VISPEALLAMKPDYVLILPWNIKSEVIADLPISGWGGKFVTAIPDMQVH